MVAGPERELQERWIGDFACGAPPEEATLEQYCSPRRLAIVISAVDPTARSYSSNPSSEGVPRGRVYTSHTDTLKEKGPAHYGPFPPRKLCRAELYIS
jgi:hypothetical protein